ncbi:BLUF domain-containing protein [Bosea minatitlanensis]|uniref:BLUF domain-containing protein n=1 Tax=Bosea minatitlanensis TaxID=128782 RepID=A0ABW0EXD2_9HYPH|nr:BLUF domain-containing protein [Bosea minatitlanensis]MCT4495134.1 BLUF domain-containing protein [Bosea minatitlanensis]
MSLIRLVYASESRLPEDTRREELERILASARRLNEQNGVSGFLLATDGGFAQVLEGSAEAVAETYGRIGRDARHAALRLLAQGPIAARSFAGWSMGIAERDETTTFIFGLYGVTPEQDLIDQPLDVIVDLARELAQSPA